MLVSNTSMKAARDTTTAMSHGFTPESEEGRWGLTASRVAMNGSTLAGVVSGRGDESTAFSNARPAARPGYLYKRRACREALAIMHSGTGIRHELAAITRIAESRNRLENSVYPV